jgi:Mrp family chromosome partitioning ATPase
VTVERTSPPSTRTTIPMGTIRAREIAEKILSDDETRMDPHQTTHRTQKFAPEELVKTTVAPPAQQRRGRITTPMGTAQSEPTTQQSPSVILASQQVLTREVPPGMLEKLAAEGSVEVRVAGSGNAPRAQVWVATHKLPEDPDPRLILIREPDSARAASFRVLRHRLQERGDPRVIAVTSAGRKEGKTTTAVNLALALGECGRARVLLVEANLRQPSLAPLFGFMPPECFTAQMARHKQKPLDGWSVVEVFSQYLHVLAIEPTDRGRPLLDGPAFSIALEMLSQAGYDYIVIDTPPVLGTADVNLIEDSADGVLFTAWSRLTSSRALRQAIEQLAPAKVLGVTLLDV